ncbi:MAG: pyridoxal-phosphate dependent enzyme, partial [Woeseiaceae bacterium]
WKGWCDLKGVGLIKQLPKIDCVQSDASAAISNTVRRIRSGGSSRIDWRSVAVDEVKAATIADSIAVDRPRDGLAAVRAIIESGGETVTVTDEDILGAIPEMARLSGIFPEPAAAAPLAAVKQMVGNNTIESDELVVCLVSGSGLKDIGSAQKAAGKPLVIDPSIDAVRDVLAAS